MNRLYYFRTLAEMSQEELAKRTGIDQGRLSRAERGGSDLMGQQWVIVSIALDCSLDELLARKEVKEIMGKQFLEQED
ncbi:MAG: helix-turn-helix transcriptional regulator [Clostridia bacterium]|nr:helix-turn-helix transcriptional regulator [Clostridia bacterium]